MSYTDKDQQPDRKEGIPPPPDFTDLIDQLSLSQENKVVLGVEIQTIIKNTSIEIDVYGGEGMLGVVQKEKLRERLKKLHTIQKSLAKFAEYEELNTIYGIIDLNPQVDALVNIDEAKKHIDYAMQAYEDAITGRNITKVNYTKRLAYKILKAISDTGNRKLNTTSDQQFISEAIPKAIPKDIPKSCIGEQTILQLIKKINRQFGQIDTL